MFGSEIFGVYADYQEQYDNIIKVDQGNDDVQFAHVLSLLVSVVAVVHAGGGQGQQISAALLGVHMTLRSEISKSVAYKHFFETLRIDKQ